MPRCLFPLFSLFLLAFSGFWVVLFCLDDQNSCFWCCRFWSFEGLFEFFCLFWDWYSCCRCWVIAEEEGGELKLNYMEYLCCFNSVHSQVMRSLIIIFLIYGFRKFFYPFCIIFSSLVWFVNLIGFWKQIWSNFGLS